MMPENYGFHRFMDAVVGTSWRKVYPASTVRVIRHAWDSGRWQGMRWEKIRGEVVDIIRECDK